MDITHDSRTLSRFNGLSKRIRSLSHSHREIFECYTQFLKKLNQLIRSKVALGLSLCIGGLIAGSLAHESATREAISSWHEAHFPSLATWSSALGTQGFKRVQGASQLHAVIRTLPLTTDAAHSVWISEDRNWITLFEEEPIVFTRLSEGVSKPTRKWLPQGRSWLGFNSIQLELSQQPPASKTSDFRSKSKTPTPSDPRAIQF
jgi:hypothetical protein